MARGTQLSLPQKHSVCLNLTVWPVVGDAESVVGG